MGGEEWRGGERRKGEERRGEKKSQATQEQRCKFTAMVGLALVFFLCILCSLEGRAIFNLENLIKYFRILLILYTELYTLQTTFIYIHWYII